MRYLIYNANDTELAYDHENARFDYDDTVKLVSQFLVDQFFNDYNK